MLYVPHFGLDSQKLISETKEKPYIIGGVTRALAHYLFDNGTKNTSFIFIFVDKINGGGEGISAMFFFYRSNCWGSYQT